MAGKRVLIIDDDPDFNLVVQKYLRKAGFDVDSAYDGVEGMEKIRKNPPDAVVLDVMMPRKDGHELCRELKQDPELSEIPVLLLTSVGAHVTSADPDVPPTAYSHYDSMCTEADDYLEKPAAGEQISEALRRLLSA
jgi:two-component system alkaline phosphatase synthesis response regulator PhoP